MTITYPNRWVEANGDVWQMDPHGEKMRTLRSGARELREGADNPGRWIERRQAERTWGPFLKEAG